MSKTPNATSEASVDALVNDLRYVVDNVDAADWPRVAGDVLEHHSPPIDEALLSIRAAKLQLWCHTMLQAMVDVDTDAVRGAAKMIKRYS